jgi:hypothetical protein
MKSSDVDPGCVQEMLDTKHNTIIIGLVMALLSLLLAVVMTVVAVRVKRLVWQTDKVIPLMLILMCCTLYSLVLFFIFNNILEETVYLNAFCRSPQSQLLKLVAEFLA